MERGAADTASRKHVSKQFLDRDRLAMVEPQSDYYLNPWELGSANVKPWPSLSPNFLADLSPLVGEPQLELFKPKVKCARERSG